MCILLVGISAHTSLSLAVAASAQQYPVVDEIANKVIQKYQNSVVRAIVA